MPNNPSKGVPEKSTRRCSKNSIKLNASKDSFEQDKRTTYRTLSILLLVLGFLELAQTISMGVTGERILNLVLIALPLVATRFMANKLEHPRTSACFEQRMEKST